MCLLVVFFLFIIRLSVGDMCGVHDISSGQLWWSGQVSMTRGIHLIPSRMTSPAEEIGTTKCVYCYLKTFGFTITTYVIPYLHYGIVKFYLERNTEWFLFFQLLFSKLLAVTEERSHLGICGTSSVCHCGETFFTVPILLRHLIYNSKEKISQKFEYC